MSTTDDDLDDTDDAIIFFGAAAEDAQLEDARLKAAFGGGGLAARPVVTIPELQRRFRDNPTEAVIANVPPHQGADEIRLWNTSGQINQLVAHYQEDQRRLDLMARNPLVVFSQRVKGFLLEIMSQFVSNMPTLNEVPYQIIRETGGAGVPPQAPLPASEGGPRVGEFVVNEVGEEQRRDLEYMRAVDTVLNTTAVTGQAELTDATVAAVASATSVLRLLNMRKFISKQLKHFLGDQDVLDLFAYLVALQLLEARIKQNAKYNKVVDLMRVHTEAIAKAREINKSVKWDASREYFVMGTPEEADREALEYARRRMYAKSGKLR
jgi:hypothetical protein